MKFADNAVATFELFNVWSRRPDWVFEARTADARLRITGTVAAPALPGPSELTVAYLDEPRGHASRPIAAQLRVLRLDVARVRLEGEVHVDALAIEIACEAALVT